MGKHLKLLSLLMLGVLGMVSAKEVVYRCDFTKGTEGWQAWCEYPENHISTGTAVVDGRPVLDLKGKGGWLTPVIFKLPKPIKCTEKTMLHFKIWADQPIECDINIGNMEEQAQYAHTFDLKANEWTEVQRYFAKSYYKFQGKPDIPNDGFLGDHIEMLQVATQGTHVMMGEIEIFEADGTEKEMPPEPAHIIQRRHQKDIAIEAVNDHLKACPLAKYPQLQRNGVFQFGVVSRLDANCNNYKWLGEDLETCLRRDLVDMRRHYLNTYYDFCTNIDKIENRLKRTEEVGIWLVETEFCQTYFPTANEKTIAKFEMAKKSPCILGWYGQDEPIFEHLARYLENKRWVNEHDPNHPYTSAMHLDEIRGTAGKAMEVMIPDIYSLRPGMPLNDPIPMLAHETFCQQVMTQSGGRRVWFMTQTFSNRHPNKERTLRLSSRYPTADEIRLDMYATLAGGANGIAFFIYNDLVSFLGGIRGEKFDFTLVDPWGNGNATYDEIAAFGKLIVPIMPSIMDAGRSHDFDATIKVDRDKFLVTEAKNDFGHYLFIVNRSLKETRDATVTFTVPDGCKVYSLTKQAEADLSKLTLGPGYGEILAVIKPETFAMYCKEINDRAAKQEADLKELRMKELRQAGFTDGNASAAWLEAEKGLESVKRTFGEMYQFIAQPNNVYRIDTAPEYEDLNGRVQTLSKAYFTLRKSHANGAVIAGDVMEQLKADIRTLQKQYEERLK